MSYVLRSALVLAFSMLGCTRAGQTPSASSPVILERSASNLLRGQAIRESIAGRWDVDVAVPDAAEGAYDPINDHYHFTLAPCPYGFDDPRRDGCLSVELTQYADDAPRSLGVARALWDGISGDESTTLHEGRAANGAMYSVRRFSVRVGFSDGLGNIVHTSKDVTRVFSFFSVDDDTHVGCIGYIERGVESMDDPDVVALRDVCTTFHARNGRSGR